MAQCHYSECVLQEISIFSIARQHGRKTFYYKHTATKIFPIDAHGDVLEDQEVGIDLENPGNVGQDVRDLINAAENALGSSIEALLDAKQNGSGFSRHGFGCADECDCVRIETFRLPNGREIDNPGHSVETGPPPKIDAVPGRDQPLAVIEKRVTIPGRGTFLLTYEIRLYGRVTRYKGRCKPRN